MIESRFPFPHTFSSFHLVEQQQQQPIDNWTTVAMMGGELAVLEFHRWDALEMECEQFYNIENAGRKEYLHVMQRNQIGWDESSCYSWKK